MNSNIDWNDTIKKEARGCNNEDLGKVQDVTNGYVLVQRCSTVNKEKFYIPQDQAESCNESILRFRISEKEIINKYKLDSDFLLLLLKRMVVEFNNYDNYNN